MEAKLVLTDIAREELALADIVEEVRSRLGKKLKPRHDDALVRRFLLVNYNDVDTTVDQLLEFLVFMFTLIFLFTLSSPPFNSFAWHLNSFSSFFFLFFIFRSGRKNGDPKQLLIINLLIVLKLVKFISWVMINRLVTSLLLLLRKSIGLYIYYNNNNNKKYKYRKDQWQWYGQPFILECEMKGVPLQLHLLPLCLKI